MYSHYINHNFDPKDQKAFEKYLAEKLKENTAQHARANFDAESSKLLAEKIANEYNERAALKRAIEMRAIVFETMLLCKKVPSSGDSKMILNSKKNLWKLKVNVIWLEKNKLLPK